MKVQIIVAGSTESIKRTKEVLEEIASMVEELQGRHYPIINGGSVEVTITYSEAIHATRKEHKSWQKQNT